MTNELNDQQLPESSNEVIPAKSAVLENSEDSADLSEESAKKVEKPETPEKKESEESSEEKELPLPGEETPEEAKKRELPKWVKKKLSKTEREVEERRQEAEAYRQELIKLQSQAGVTSRNVPGTDPNAPKRADFQSEEEFIDARYSYNKARDEAIREELLRTEAISKHEQNFQSKFKSALSEGEEKYDDFEEKIAVLTDRSFPTNRAMAEAITDSPYRADMLYFLGTHKDHARKIAGMSPIEAVKEITKLEMRFLNQQKSKISKAPAPIESVGGGKTSAMSGGTMEDLNRVAKGDDMDAFEKELAKFKQKNKKVW